MWIGSSLWKKTVRERWKKTYDVGRGRGRWRRDGIREVGSVGRSHPCSHQNGESLSIDSHSLPYYYSLRHNKNNNIIILSPASQMMGRKYVSIWFPHVPWALEKWLKELTYLILYVIRICFSPFYWVSASHATVTVTGSNPGCCAWASSLC